MTSNLRNSAVAIHKHETEEEAKLCKPFPRSLPVPLYSSPGDILKYSHGLFLAVLDQFVMLTTLLLLLYDLSKQLYIFVLLLSSFHQS